MNEHKELQIQTAARLLAFEVIERGRAGKIDREFACGVSRAVCELTSIYHSPMRRYPPYTLEFLSRCWDMHERTAIKPGRAFRMGTRQL